MNHNEQKVLEQAACWDKRVEHPFNNVWHIDVHCKVCVGGGGGEGPLLFALSPSTLHHMRAGLMLVCMQTQEFKCHIRCCTYIRAQ